MNEHDYSSSCDLKSFVNNTYAVRRISALRIFCLAICTYQWFAVSMAVCDSEDAAAPWVTRSTFSQSIRAYSAGFVLFRPKFFHHVFLSALTANHAPFQIDISKKIWGKNSPPGGFYPNIFVKVTMAPLVQCACKISSQYL